MGLIPGTVWKIFFPAVFCLAKAETMGKVTADFPDAIYGNTRIAQALQCMNGINSEENVFTVLIAPKNSTFTTAQENTTDFPRITMPIIVFGNTATTERYSVTVSELGGTIAGRDPTTNKAASRVSSIAFEEITKNIIENVINTTSVGNPYKIYTTTSGPGGATAPNGETTADTENAINFLEEEPSMSQDEVLSAENPGSTALFSTENTNNAFTGKTTTKGKGNPVNMGAGFGDVPGYLPHKTQGNTACYSVCEIIPPWGTVILCLGTAFFIFALVGLLFLLPYCTKFRRSSPVSSSSSPQYSV